MKTAPATDFPAETPASKTDDHDETGVFHVKHPSDQDLGAFLDRRLKTWAGASRKAWRTRKSMAEHREALLKAEREEQGEA